MKLYSLFLTAFFLINFSFAQIPRCIEKNYRLVWQDEFEGEKIDTSKWSYRATGSKRGRARVRKDNCYLDGNGHLVIEARKDSNGYTVGQIATMQKQLWKFGYFECRAKMTNQLGPSCAFWLQTPKLSHTSKNTYETGAEIDIMEYRRKESHNKITHTVHWGGYRDLHEQKGKVKRVKNLDEGFHTFGLKWTDKNYVFYVDGKRSWCTRKAISHVMQYIILCVEIVEWGGDPSNSTFPDKAIFDYVRVYKMK